MSKQATRKRAAQRKPMPVVHIAWYAEGQEWARVKASATDPERFEDTYQEWSAMIEETLIRARTAGAAPVKVPVQADELLRWCRQHGKENNAAARAEFVCAPR